MTDIAGGIVTLSGQSFNFSGVDTAPLQAIVDAGIFPVDYTIAGVSFLFLIFIVWTMTR